MNILICSAGTRNKVVQAFKETLSGQGKVIAADASSFAPALYEADKSYIVPRITAPDYIDCLLTICKKENVNGILSLIDPELSLLASNREHFLAIGTIPVVSSYDLCELCLDKYRMYQFLKGEGIRTGECWISLEDFEEARKQGKVDFPVFVKPQCGSASIGIKKVNDEEQLEALFAEQARKNDPSSDHIMVQELMRGQEYGCDVYIDLLSHQCTSLFLKKKIRMRAGETDKSISVKDDALARKIASFVEECGFRGCIDIDLFHDEHGKENSSSQIPEGEWYLSEINPRFGGGYPHAYACGVNFARSILWNLEGKENPVTIGEYDEGIVMMKYNEIMVRQEEELTGNS